MLGELEELIMEALWRMKEGTVRQVLEVVCRRRPLAYTTVMTVMTRLTDKKILDRRPLPDGSFIYQPCCSREELYAATSRAFFGELIKKFGSVAVAQFVDVLEKVDPEQISQLKELLKKYEEQK